MSDTRETPSRGSSLDDVIAADAAACDARAEVKAVLNPTTEAAAQEARLIKEARMLPNTGELNEAQIAYAREKLRTYLDAKGVPIAVAARKMGYSPSTVSQFLDGCYAGDVSKVARKAVSAVEQMARGEDPGLPAGFVSTRQVDILFGMASMAQKTRKIAVYTGGSGTSKTLCAQAIVAGSVPGITTAYHVRVTAAHTSPREFARLVARTIDSKPKDGTRARILEGILAELDGRDAMIIIDDAQRLHPSCDGLILDMNKIAGASILILDTLEFDARSGNETRWDGQFARNIVHRHNAIEEQERSGGTPLYTVDEIHKYARSMGLRLAGDAAEWLTETACMPGSGGLGRVAMLLLNARLVMDKEGKDRIELRHVQSAWAMSRGLKHLGAHEARRALFAGRKAKVA